MHAFRFMVYWLRLPGQRLIWLGLEKFVGLTTVGSITDFIGQFTRR
jgi:hypothetical protein